MQDKILIVDDTRTNIDILVNILDDYDLLVATNGQEALDITAKDDIDLILLDIMMPEMDGYEVCRVLKDNEKTKDIPVIFITAKTDDSSIMKGFEVGGIDYITKPFRPIELISRVKTHLKLKKHEKNRLEEKKFDALENLIKNLVHHWRQPLSVIATMASGMSIEKESGILTDEIFYENCDSIYNYTQELSLTLENLNNIIDNKSYQKESFYLDEIINKSYEFLFNDAIKENIEIVLNIKNTTSLYLEKEVLLNCLLNLIQNSKNAFIKNKISKKYIFIDTVIKEDTLSIIVKDNAGGIDESILDNIFEPYLTSEHQFFGKGLGLYSVHNSIRNMLGGRISAQNEKYFYKGTEYKGALIKIELKVSEDGK